MNKQIKEAAWEENLELGDSFEPIITFSPAVFIGVIALCAIGIGMLTVIY